jgi:hypothetical protein
MLAAFLAQVHTRTQKSWIEDRFRRPKNVTTFSGCQEIFLFRQTSWSYIRAGSIIILCPFKGKTNHFQPKGKKLIILPDTLSSFVFTFPRPQPNSRGRQSYPSHAPLLVLPMATTHTRTPQPPAKASSPAAHRRQRTFSSPSPSSSTSSSSLSTSSSAASTPSPSPRGAVPFSWEHHPGIAKVRLPADAASPPAPPLLPLPPPLRAAPPSGARRGHRRRAADPFAAALAECTRERSSAGSDAGLIDSLFPASPAAPSTRPRWSIAAAGGGLLDLYGCKNAMAVAEGAFILRRPVARPGHGRVGQGGRR